jgi:23S rRNA (guanosine2251-2'-O)-methyltransferase
VVPHRRDALERIVLHATTLRIPIVEVEGGTLTALAGFDGHQGVAVVLEERRFASLEDVLARAIERGEPPFVLALDSLEDPQNLGSLLRSAEAAGVHGVLFPIRRQAPLTPAAVKASAGAVEHLLLVPVDDLAGALADLHVRGTRVVGHEGQGLGPAVRRRCDLLVRIPMRGRIASLNAAVAGSILLFEASGQRGEAPPARPSRPEEPAVPAGPVAPASAGQLVEEPGPVPSAKRIRKTVKAAEAAAEAGEPAAAPRKARKTRAVADTPPASAAPSSDPVTAAGPTGIPDALIEDADLLPGAPPVVASEPRAKRSRKAASPPTGAETAPDPAAGDAPTSKRRRAKA